MKYDKYIKVMEWARKRYTVDGVLIQYIGLYETTYTRIERLAWNKYIS